MPQDYPVPHPIKAVLAGRRQTITGLSAAVGVNPSTLGRVINGYVAPWPGLRRKASEALGIPESDLFESPRTVGNAS
jgi:transcriptional regulator with XRE-family HTH domain